MKKLLPFLFLLTGCASFPFRVTGWNTPNHVVLDDNQPAIVLGNPRITCRTTRGFVVADGLFVEINDENYLVVDEFGKEYLLVPNDPEIYCFFWERDK